MSIVKIDPASVALDTADLSSVANALATAANTLNSALGSSSGMAGDDPAGEMYATGEGGGGGYDHDAPAVVKSVVALADNVNALEALVQNTARAYKQAEMVGALQNPGGCPIAAATAPPSRTAPTPPNACGTGTFLGLGEFGEFLEDALKGIGVVIPNGDSGKLRSAASSWDAFGADIRAAKSSLASTLPALGAATLPQKSDILAVRIHLVSELNTQASNAEGMGRGCSDFATQIDDMRTELMWMVGQMTAEILLDIALSAALGFFTAGISVAAGAAKIVITVARWANKIAHLIDRFKTWMRGLNMLLRTLVRVGLHGAQSAVVSTSVQVAVNVAGPEALHQNLGVTALSSFAGGGVAGPLGTRFAPNGSTVIRSVGVNTGAGVVDGGISEAVTAGLTGQPYNVGSLVLGGLMGGAGGGFGHGGSSGHGGGSGGTGGGGPSGTGGGSGPGPIDVGGSGAPTGAGGSSGSGGSSSAGGGGTAPTIDANAPTPTGNGGGGSQPAGGGGVQVDSDAPTPGGGGDGGGSGADAGNSVEIPDTDVDTSTPIDVGGSPDGPTMPEFSNAPDAPTAPTGTPDGPTMPEFSNAPDAPTTPAGAPDGPTMPEFSNAPDAPATSDAPASPDAGGTPDAPASPDGGTPDAPAAPDAPATPDASQPAGPAGGIPMAPGGTPSTPDAPAAPDAPTSPDGQSPDATDADATDADATDADATDADATDADATDADATDADATDTDTTDTRDADAADAAAAAGTDATAPDGTTPDAPAAPETPEAPTGNPPTQLSLAEIDAALSAINPHFDGTPQSEFSNNCGTTSTILNDVLNGAPIRTAESGDGTLTPTEVEAATGLPQTPMTPDEIVQSLQDLGAGAHGVVGFDRTTGAGHWFNVYFDGTQAWSLDAQSGTRTPFPPANEPNAVNWDFSVDTHATPDATAPDANAPDANSTATDANSTAPDATAPDATAPDADGTGADGQPHAGQTPDGPVREAGSGTPADHASDGSDGPGTTHNGYDIPELTPEVRADLEALAASPDSPIVQAPDGTFHLADPVGVDPFSRTQEHHDFAEFVRQLDLQQQGLNDLSVGEWLHNLDYYEQHGRVAESEQAAARQDLIDAGVDMDGQDILHGPDQIGGGRADRFDGGGDSGVNRSIGSQWKHRIDALLGDVLAAIEGIDPALLPHIDLNVVLGAVDRG